MDRKAEIKKLLQGIERYSPEHRNALEEHILWQIHNNEYDLEANLALLRLYQFYPIGSTQNMQNFTLCKYLLNLEHLSKEPLSHVVELGYLLETCRFTEFWIKLKENPKMTASLSGFRESIYKFIMHIVSKTYQRIPKTMLMSFLDISSEKDFKQLIKQYGWTEITSNDNVQLILVNNHEENIKSIKIREQVNFDSITSMSGAFRPSKSDFSSRRII
ncbi:unnamed protein product [Heterobilharzia americana]|nr:unnamed protein product [Heterobilharzia americana]